MAEEFAEEPEVGKAAGKGVEAGEPEPERVGRYDAKTLKELFRRGWKPYIQGNYIVIRKGDFKRSLGRYSEEAWRLVNSLFLEAGEEAGGRSPVSGLLSTSASKPPQVQRIQLDLDVLYYYEWMRQKYERQYGRRLTLSDFLNGIVKLYFEEKGIRPVIVIGAPAEVEVEVPVPEGGWVPAEGGEGR
jgi:hypothetical protein